MSVEERQANTAEARARAVIDSWEHGDGDAGKHESFMSLLSLIAEAIGKAEDKAWASAAASPVKMLDGFLMQHAWHRWFAWRPQWVPDLGRVWLRTVERRFSVRTWHNGDQTVTVNYRPRARANISRAQRVASMSYVVCLLSIVLGIAYLASTLQSNPFALSSSLVIQEDARDGAPSTAPTLQD